MRIASSCREAAHGDWDLGLETGAANKFQFFGVTYIRIIGERIKRQLCEEFWMLDVFEIVFPEGAIGISVLEQDM